MSGATESGATSGDAVAAIDCGTNSTRLLVAGADGTSLERINRITRLGENVDETGRLGREAIARTIAVLEDYRGVLDAHGVLKCRMTATSAARDASNRDEFFDAAEAAVGVRPELLDGMAEGQLSFRGALSGLPESGGPWLVVDIGGGSTELIVGIDLAAGPTGVISMDVGCVRVTERFLTSDPPTSTQIDEARLMVRFELTKALDQVPQLEAGKKMVGVAGTVACLAAVDQEIDGSDTSLLHHYRITRRRVNEMCARLGALPARERLLVPGVEEGRADVIVGGAIVLAEVMARFGFEDFLTSESDILDGLAASLLERAT